MGNLINNIPVNKPQNIVVQPKTTIIEQNNKTVQEIFPEFQKYSYIPAKPISPGSTSPKSVKPLSPKGYLVKENIFQSAASTVKSYAKYAKYFYNAAVKGEGSDYSVGKINDLAIRTGSLGIAGLLATQKLFPFAKGMEFVGYGTWFASMALWPRIIGTLVKWKTGVDINQKYVDSYGRRKNFLEDPQYIVWDLYKHIDKNGNFNKNAPDFEKFDKIGDKLGIPRNIKNRREAIQDKYKQVGVQANALTMLTAGVMTPVLSSVIADSLQKPLQNKISQSRIKQGEKHADKLKETITTLINNGTSDITQIAKTLNIEPSTRVTQKFEALLKDQSDQLNSKNYEKLLEFFEKRYFGTGISTAVTKELKNAMNSSERILYLSEDVTNDLIKISTDSVKELFERVNPEKRNVFPEVIKNWKGLTSAEISAAMKESGVVPEMSAIGITEQNSIKNLLPRKATWILKSIKPDEKINQRYINKLQQIMTEKIEQYYKEKGYMSISAEKVKKLFNFAEINLQLDKKLKEIEKTTVYNISESATAIHWERIPQEYFKTLGFNQKQINEIASLSATAASEKLAKRFEEIVQNPDLYKEVVSKMSKLAATATNEEELAVFKLIGDAHNDGLLRKAQHLMKYIASKNFSEEMTGEINSIYHENMKRIYEKLINTNDSFFRPIRALDIFKNIDQYVENILGENVEQFKKNLKNTNVYYTFITPADPNKVKTEADWAKFYEAEYAKAKESLKAYIKDIVLQKNDINDWMTKMEVIMPGYKKGINHSKTMLWRIADIVNGPITEESKNIIVNQQQTSELKSFVKNFIETSNARVEKLKFAFMSTVNEIWPHANEYNINKGLLEYFFNKDNANNIEGLNAKFEEIKKILEDRIFDLGEDTVKEAIQKLKDYKDIYRTYSNDSYNRSKVIEYLQSKINYSLANTSITKRSGKNVTEFFIKAAENNTARTKWTKLAYGLLIGTSVITALFISVIGRKNYFNKDKYEPLNKS